MTGRIFCRVNELYAQLQAVTQFLPRASQFVWSFLERMDGSAAWITYCSFRRTLDHSVVSPSGLLAIAQVEIKEFMGKNELSVGQVLTAAERKVSPVFNVC